MARTQHEYGRDDGALPGYAVSLGVYGAAAAAVAAAAWRTGRRPAPSGPVEIALLALATHKISRIAAKDAVTSPVRAAVTKFRGSAGDAELHEEVRAHGAKKALAELVTCPFCMGPWVAGSLVAASTFVPGLTRPVVAVFAAVGGADFLHLAYSQVQQRQVPPEQRGVDAREGRSER
jgi:hypothetical protein